MYEDVITTLDLPALRAAAHAGPPPVFATISGAHLYGFASPDSDIDLRGAFLRPLREIVGVHPPEETVTIVSKTPLDLDWVAHDLRKFARMMLSHNGYVLEQLFSPIVVVETPLLAPLRELGRGCVTRGTVNHYQGFARGRRKRLAEPDPTVKHLLYAYRVLLSGIHLMQTGELLCHVGALTDRFRIAEVDELVARKRQGAEKMAISAAELDTHAALLDSLEARLADAHARSHLPDEPTSRAALEALVVDAQVAR